MREELATSGLTLLTIRGLAKPGAHISGLAR